MVTTDTKSVATISYFVGFHHSNGFDFISMLIIAHFISSKWKNMIKNLEDQWLWAINYSQKIMASKTMLDLKPRVVDATVKKPLSKGRQVLPVS